MWFYLFYLGWRPEVAITMVDTADTISSMGQFGSDVNMMKAYAYILTHPGTPSVTWAGNKYIHIRTHMF